MNLLNFVAIEIAFYSSLDPSKSNSQTRNKVRPFLPLYISFVILILCKFIKIKTNCKNKEDNIMSFATESQGHDHLNYLYISYVSLIPQSINQLEIPREVETGDTLMRVILGSIKNKKVAFFNLVKSRGINYKKPLLKFIVDIHNQDILMTHKAFLKLVSLMKLDASDNKDPRPNIIYNHEIFDTNDEALNFNCFTKYEIQPKKSRKNNHIKKGTRKKRV